MKESKAWIILASKNDDSINNFLVEFITTSNLSLFPWFCKHYILSLGQMSTVIFKNNVSSSKYLASWRKETGLFQISTFVSAYKAGWKCVSLPAMARPPTDTVIIKKDFLRNHKLSKKKQLFLFRTLLSLLKAKKTTGNLMRITNRSKSNSKGR